MKEQQSVQIVFENTPILRIFLPDGTKFDCPLRKGQLIVIAEQALATLRQCRG